MTRQRSQAVAELYESSSAEALRYVSRSEREIFGRLNGALSLALATLDLTKEKSSVPPEVQSVLEETREELIQAIDDLGAWFVLGRRRSNSR